MASRTLSVTITGDASKLRKANAEAAGSVNKLGGDVKRSASSMVAAMGLTVGGALAVRKAFSEFNGVAGDVAKLSRLTGESAESMSALRYAASTVGIGTEQLSKGLIALEKNIPNGKVASFGIAVKDAAGNALPMEQVLANVADKFASMPNGIDKTNLATDLFGKRIGAGLIPLLNKGSAGLAETTAKAKELGLIMSSKDLEIRKESIDAMREMKAQSDALFVSVGRELVPAVTSGVRVLNQVPAPVKAAGVAALGASIAFDKLAASEIRAASGASKVLSVVVAAVTAIESYKGATAALTSASEWNAQRNGAGELAGSLDDLSAVAPKVKKLADEIKVLNDTSILGQGPFDASQANAFIDKTDKALAALVNSGHADKAAQQYSALIAALKPYGITVDDLAFRLNDYEAASDKAEASAARHIGTAREASGAIRGEATEMERATAAVANNTATKNQAMLVNRERVKSMQDEIAKSHELRSATDSLKDAIKAYNDNERTAAGQGPVIAQMRADAAEQAKQDAESIRQAQQAEVDAARGLASAQRGLDDAYHSRSEALRAVTAAERELANDQRQAVVLTKALAKAYDDAKESLYQLQQGAKGDKLSVQAAQFALDDARRAQLAGADPGSDDPNAQAKLDLAVAQATLALEQAKHDAAKGQEELTSAQAAGLAQSPQVQAAQQAIADNAIATAEAQHGLTEAQRGVQAADQQIRDSAYEVARARQAVGDAARTTAEAVRKASDDEVIAQFEIYLAIEAAKKQQGELADAVEVAFGRAVTAAQGYGLNLEGIKTYLGEITTMTAPGSPLASNLAALFGTLPTAVAGPSGPTAAQTAAHQGRGPVPYGNAEVPGAAGNRSSLGATHNSLTIQVSGTTARELMAESRYQDWLDMVPG